MKPKNIYWIVLALLSPAEISAQGRSFVQINTSVSVHFLVIDPHGRRTGVDPREAQNPQLGKELNEIPGANYSTTSVGDSPENEEPLNSDFSREFLFKPQSPENDGEYLIEVVGIEPGKYSISVYVAPKRESKARVFRTSFYGLTDANQVTRFQFVYRGNPENPASLTKIVKSADLRQDLDNSFKFGLLIQHGLYTELSTALDQFERDFGRKDTMAAVKRLGEFLDVINKEHEKPTKPNDNRYIKDEAWQILSEDTKNLIEQLSSLSFKAK